MGAIIPVFIPHVGCPHDCVFCNQKKIAGTIAPPTAEDVTKIIEEALAKIKSRAEVAFYGGSFTAISGPDMTAYLDAVAPYIESGEISSIRLSTRPDCIDDEVLSLLREKGVKTIELGVQSMDEDVLLKSGRGHTAFDARNAAKLVRRYGFSLILQMMTHLPGSDEQKDIYTAREIAKLNPDGVRVYPTVVIKDTALLSLMQKGEYIPATPKEAARLGAEILEIFDEENIPVIRFGLNPSDELSAGDAVCGAYHPALGEMAMSERFFQRIRKEAEEKGISGENINIYVARGKKSACVGQKRANIKKLTEETGFSSVRVFESDALSGFSVVIERS
ncbi:MAG: radical SAM protein [Oscillospiraceae bacterium]|nr:radical SAM protein [Oscillospiraceae bacterium]